MSKIETICPFCKKTNAVEKTNFGVSEHGLQDIQCSHCSKSWSEDLSLSGRLAKSAPAPSSGMAELRQRLIELGKVVDAFIERQAVTPPARFNPKGVEKDGMADQELSKALANGKPVTFQSEESQSPRFQTVSSIGSGQRVRSGQPFDVSGVEKSDTADAELRKALGSGKPLGAFIPRD